jgi:hypothetical protein
MASSFTASHRFTLNILSVPQLVQHLPGSVLNALVVSFPNSLAVSAASFSDKRMDPGPKAILDNLLDLVNATIRQHNTQISVRSSPPAYVRRCTVDA